MKELRLPDKLYGREDEINFLVTSYKKISSGQGKILLVPGHSGVGKTSLVKQLEKPVKKGNGYFIHGKFDQYQQDIPYFAFRQALNVLSHAFLADTEELRERKKAYILQKIGTQARVLIDLEPELEKFFGPQPKLGQVSPQEARYRFYNVFNAFLQAVCRPENPMVIFIDDWQWADSASLQLIKQLDVGNSLRYVLIIAAYRNNEVTPVHPFNGVIEYLRAKDIPIQSLEVRNLYRDDVLKIISDSLKPGLEASDDLASLIQNKTQGNPYFVISYIKHLYNFHFLTFNASKNKWEWHADENDNKKLPVTIIDLFVEKIKTFNPELQRLLSQASCLGNRFNPELLSIISNKPEKLCQSLLNTSDAQKIITRLYDENLKKPIDTIHAQEIEYVFKHDSLQQAAFSLIPKDVLPAMLLDIGRLLSTKLSFHHQQERIFEIVNKLNAGHVLITSPDEFLDLVEMNVRAARKAYQGTAYNAALHYYRLTEILINKQGVRKKLWEKHHSFAISLYKERAQCEFLEGDSVQAHHCIKEALKHASSAMERADIYNVLIVQNTLEAKYADAIEAGRKALKELGIDLPDENYETARDLEIKNVRNLLEHTRIESLADMPPMDNPEILLTCKVLITMGPPCYRFHQKLWAVIVPKVVAFTIQYGHIPQIGYSHTAFGGLLLWVDNDFETARKFSELATEIMSNTKDAPSDQSVFYLMIGSSNRHWFKHLKYSSQDYADAYDIGLRSGNLQYAAYAFGHNMYCSFFQGINLEALLRDTRQSLDFSKTRHNQWAIDLFEGGIRLFNMMASGLSGIESMDPGADKTFLENVKKHQNIQVECVYYILKSCSYLILNDYQTALEYSNKTRPILYTVGSQGLLPWPEHVFSRLMILTSLFQEFDSNEQTHRLNEIKETVSLIKLWADNCKENFEHKYYLACAELARIEKNAKTAIAYYYKAIDAAKNDGFLIWEAIANEKASLFWRELGQQDMAFHYWQQAYICYNRWGGNTKTDLMEADYKKHLAGQTSFISNATGEQMDEKTLHTITERRIRQVRDYVRNIAEVEQREQTDRKARELAEATQRLRTEIAERKKTEEALRKSEEEVRQKNDELEKLNIEKDKFFSIIAHDLRSPFTTILGLTRILHEQAKAGEFNKVEIFTENVVKASNSALDLLTNLMEWSKSQTGRFVYNPEVIKISSIIEENKRLFIETANQKQITIQTLTPLPQQPLFIDRAMISTVLRNLLSNAIKFTPAGGFIYIGAEERQSDILITVKDTGIGISEKAIDKLFRTDINFTTPGTNQEKGTGLGLILCKEFVEKNNGEIWVESQEGKGSTFFFTVPGYESGIKKENLSINTESGPGTADGTILIAEDESINYLLLETLLKDQMHLNCNILHVLNGQDAVEICKENNAISLILMDIRMPIMNGYEAAKKIKEIRPELPIIAQSAYPVDKNSDIFDGYIEKPIKSALLKELIEKITDLNVI